eukprot:TRINITY_DN35633_c0_g1_i2.p1 TRINITY_DN35633_c0_g1~~TRINITY_DN35633_c0_g1_i2.p1  ORF type:complete len:266 (-),score=50.51 TRINITY_DN35633_c0_g1_i2:10-807(-)
MLLAAASRSLKGNALQLLRRSSGRSCHPPVLFSQQLQTSVRLCGSKPEAEAKDKGEKKAEEPKEENSPFLFGASASAVVLMLARLPRFLPFAAPLQIFAVVPLLVGALQSFRDGLPWSLLWLTLPGGGIAAYATNSTALEPPRRERLGRAAAEEIKEACPSVPQEALDALVRAEGKEFATNNLRLEAAWPPSGVEASAGNERHWRVEIVASRSFGWQDWSADRVRVLCDTPVPADKNPSKLPPQTRDWNASAQQVQSQLMWERRA